MSKKVKESFTLEVIVAITIILGCIAYVLVRILGG